MPKRFCINSYCFLLISYCFIINTSANIYRVLFQVFYWSAMISSMSLVLIRHEFLCIFIKEECYYKKVTADVYFFFYIALRCFPWKVVFNCHCLSVAVTLLKDKQYVLSSWNFFLMQLNVTASARLEKSSVNRNFALGKIPTCFIMLLKIILISFSLTNLLPINLENWASLYYSTVLKQLFCKQADSWWSWWSSHQLENF